MRLIRRGNFKLFNTLNPGRKIYIHPAPRYNNSASLNINRCSLVRHIYGGCQ